MISIEAHHGSGLSRVLKRIGRPILRTTGRFKVGVFRVDTNCPLIGPSKAACLRSVVAFAPMAPQPDHPRTKTSKENGIPSVLLRPRPVLTFRNKEPGSNRTLVREALHVAWYVFVLSSERRHQLRIDRRQMERCIGFEAVALP